MVREGYVTREAFSGLGEAKWRLALPSAQRKIARFRMIGSSYGMVDSAAGETPRKGTATTALDGVRTASDPPLGYNKGVARTMGLVEQSNGGRSRCVGAVMVGKEWLVGGNELSRVAMMADGGGGSLV